MRQNLYLLCSALALSIGCGDKDEDTSGTDDTGGGGTGGADFCASITEGFCTLTGTYTESLTLTTEYQYVLEGGVFIGDDTTNTILTIEPGVTVYGDSASDAFLAIRRNAQIQAEGTADAPIVFTSPQAVGSRDRSDWGGLIINGNAPVNNCYNGSEVLPCEAEGEGGTGLYGGSSATDSSGVLKYVRVEFGGTEISPENEVNGIAFQGVGSGTTVSYIQVHMNKDDGVEFFGGTVSADHLVLTAIGDDSLDYTDGWTGTVSDVYIRHFAGYESDKGLEMDNNGDQNDATPRSNPTLRNVTIVGSPDGSAGFLVRAGSAGTFENINITGSGTCFDIDGDATWTQAQDGALTVTGTTLDCDAPFADDSGEGETFSGDIPGWFSGQSGNSTSGTVDDSLPSWATGWINEDLN